MQNTLAIMFTMTTYGTWLRGDKRGWVDDGRVMPPEPNLEAADIMRLKHAPFQFEEDGLFDVGKMIGESLISRKQVRILALSVASWHVHFVVGAPQHPLGGIVKCAKDSVRYGLRPNRPIWTAGYDKRFCFDEEALDNRVRYVERHNEELGWPAKPWPFLVGYQS